MMRALVCAALLACGCDPIGKTLELTLESGCPNLGSAETVRVEVVSTPQIANSTRDLPASDVFGADATRRLVLLFPESVQTVDVTVRVLDPGGSERVSGFTHLDISQPGNYMRTMTLAAAACPVPDMSTSDPVTDLRIDFSANDGGCGVLRLTGGHADAPHLNDYNLPGDFTLEAWIYIRIPVPAPPAIERNIVGHWGSGAAGTASWALYLTPDRRPTIAISCNGTVGVPHFQWVSGNDSLQLDRWYHVAAEYEQSTQRGRVYVDGMLASTTPANLGCPMAHPVSGIPLTIAHDDLTGGRSFLGDVDEIRVSHGHRYATIHPFTPAHTLASDVSTVALFHFEPPASSGTTAADSSTRNNNAATLTPTDAVLTSHCR
jgi:hypothetical protein